jgi:ketosteroid isomerase-like protein
MSDVVLDTVSKSSTQWKSAFNSGDAKACAEQYENNAVMHARPFGTFIGTEQIQTFGSSLSTTDFQMSNTLTLKLKLLMKQVHN